MNIRRHKVNQSADHRISKQGSDISLANTENSPKALADMIKKIKVASRKRRGAGSGHYTSLKQICTEQRDREMSMRVQMLDDLQDVADDSFTKFERVHVPLLSP